jgi:hypothetical protein
MTEKSMCGLYTRKYGILDDSTEQILHTVGHTKLPFSQPLLLDAMINDTDNNNSSQTFHPY